MTTLRRLALALAALILIASGVVLVYHPSVAYDMGHVPAVLYDM